MIFRADDINIKTSPVGQLVNCIPSPSSAEMSQHHSTLPAELLPYHRDRYDLSFESHALGWLVQFAIRADLKTAQLKRPLYDRDNRIDAFADLSKFLQPMRELIRANHVIDEPQLKEAKLSLYNFPTLAEFFFSRERQSFVREATVCEIRNALVDTCSQTGMMENGEGEADSDPAKLLEVCDFAPIGRSLPSEIAKKHGKDSPKKILCLLDFTAPATALDEQFKRLVAKLCSKKSVINSRYQDWINYGVLPLNDLEDWVQYFTIEDLGDRIKAPLLYSTPHYDEQTVSKKTRPLLRDALNTRSNDFSDLVAAATEEFDAAVSFARGDCPPVKHNAAKEALDRWFPWTYPYDVPYLERGSRSVAHAGCAGYMLDILSARKNLELSLIERIRHMDHDGDYDLPLTEHIMDPLEIDDDTTMP